MRPPLDTAKFGMFVGVLGLATIVGLAGWVLLITDNFMNVLIALAFILALAFVVRVRK